VRQRSTALNRGTGGGKDNQGQLLRATSASCYSVGEQRILRPV